MVLTAERLARDWHRQAVVPPPEFSLKLVDDHLWFEASREAPARSAPFSQPGHFQAELWKHDVAELFLADRTSGRYLELNLAPNGAWWACWFADVRTPESNQPDFSSLSGRGASQPSGWHASLRVPVADLPPLQDLTWNVTFILESPEQVFVSAAELGDGEPDFHRPTGFRPLIADVPA
ncbi:MAG: hypothetical protein Q7Q71_13570 [Verrucomicrobiota bacterium JB023]|nr:hypothetical protein [Verrucomicrobiota bacterium JB023]